MPYTLKHTLRDPRLVILSTGLLVWALLLAAANGKSPRHAPPDHETAADATPDSGPLPPDPFPAQTRARLLARMGVDRWHKAGHRGQGVKVAILDSGFRGYREHLGKSLPAQVTTRSFRADENLEARDSQHGILCGEVVHALAPEAELLLANWEPDSPQKWLEAAAWAKEQGARIISCSVIMPSWSDAEGNGPIHEALTRILNNGDALFFASAGNTAQRHWAGEFTPGEDGWHEWLPGRTDNGLSPWGSDQVSVETCWQTDADFELVVRDVASDREMGRSVGRADVDRRCAVVRFMPETKHKYAVRLRQVRGEPTAFHMVALSSALSSSTARGSICFPGDGPEVIAVGAVGLDGQRAAYSCCGPNSKQPKPDLTAFVPFSSLWRARPFTGTSAAAPQAAGLAAVLWSSQPGWKGRQVRAALARGASDVGAAGHDHETGHGILCLPEGAQK